MEYAIIKSGGKQYKVAPGDIIEVDRLGLTSEKPVTFDEVLLVVSNGTAEVGTPTVVKATVTGKVLAETKGDKIYVQKFKSKVRFRRRTGFRAQLTQIRIDEIVSGVEKKTKKG
jgi:large subunit ribosomal protein L21